MAGLWKVLLVYGWSVCVLGGLDGLCVVTNFTAYIFFLHWSHLC